MRADTLDGRESPLLLARLACLLAVLLLQPWVCRAFTWHDYKERFLLQDGRIIDTYQHNRSHSEGQGYGMLLAIANRDRQALT